MVLFVDETENEDLFLVGGVLVESREDAIRAYNRFKKRISNIPLTENNPATCAAEASSLVEFVPARAPSAHYTAKL